MSNPLARFKEGCNLLLEQAASVAYPEIILPVSKYAPPPNTEMGELSSPISFQLAKQLKRKPDEIAQTIVEKIETNSSDLIETVNAVSGYINFTADISKFSKLVLENIIAEDEEYGLLKTLHPEKVMVEHTSANPNGPIHIGNARNSILGSCLSRMLKNRGHDVVIHFLVNDMGRQVAMATYGWQLLGKPEPEGHAELWVGTIYASVNVINELSKLEAQLNEAEIRGRVAEIVELQDNIQEYKIAANELRKRYSDIYDSLAEKLPQIENSETEIIKLNTAYENNEPEATKDVRKLIGFCLKGFETSLGEIGIAFDSFDFESDLVWDNAAEQVLEGLRETSYIFEDDGAIILDCDKIALDFNLKNRWGLNPDHEIPRLVLVRSDGTTLYTLRDMAYHIWKFNFVERVVNVIGYEQTLAQLQLRLALAALGKIWMGDKLRHYSYEFVKLPGTKMSGRLGRYVTLIDVIDKATELAYDEVTKRSPYISEAECKNIARIVGYGAVKYTMLSIDPMKTVVFDWDKALNFETNSAPYIQYSHARACNILKRALEKPEPEYKTLGDSKEKAIIMALATFPEIFESAVEELKPGDITSYANALADKFNSFYASLPVLKAKTLGQIGARLRLVEAIKITLRNALNTLGIVPPERM